MANDLRYPTPPPTLSPNSGFHPSSTLASNTTSNPLAQASYFDSTSYPADQPPFHPTWASPTEKVYNQAYPPSQTSSPLLPNPMAYSQSLPQQPLGAATNPRSRTPSRKSTPIGQNPIYYSPVNQPPTPYNPSRPKPRPGLRKRILNVVSSWIRSFALWTKRNPIKAGVITFLPVMGAAGIARVFGTIGNMLGKSKNGVDKVVSESRVNAKKADRAIKDGNPVWGWGFDEFVGFNSSRGGPLDGILKVLQMWV